ncbi:MAG: sigma-70 family RNA polymerase sigma factor [Chloroflexota bacterium]
MQDVQPLLSRAQAGDVDAYAVLVTQFQDMAVGYAYSVVGDFHLAEDIAQEAFVEAYTHLSRVYNANAFPSWLRRILFKQCDRLTRRKRLTTVPLDGVQSIFSSEPTPLEVVFNHEVTDELSAAIHQLSDSQRMVILLYYISEYSQKEVAAFLGIPTGTVNNRLHAARKQLLKLLQSSEFSKGTTLSMVQENLQRKRPSEQSEFVDGVLNLLAPDKGQHSHALYTLVDAGDPNGTYRNGRIAHSRYDWQSSRLGFKGEQPVVNVGVYDITMRIGAAQVRVAGVNSDKVHPDYQDSDFTEQAVREALEAMQANGYDLSLACMVDPKSFAAVGYVNAFPENHFYMRTDDLPTEPPPISMEAFSADQLESYTDQFAQLYNQENEGVTGTTVRPNYRRSKVPGGYGGYLWRNTDGELAGYVLIYPAHPPEASADISGQVISHEESAGSFEERLRVLGYLAREWGYDQVEFFRQPYNGPLGRHLRSLDARVERGYRHWQKHMIRILNLKSLMSQLTGELSRRLRQSYLKDWQGDLMLSDDTAAVTLRIDRANCHIVETSGSELHRVEGGAALAQLVVGTEEPLLTIEGHRMKISGDAAALVSILFPAQYPQMGNQAL